MTYLYFHCVWCGKRLKTADDSILGRRIRCPKCGSNSRVPHSETERNEALLEENHARAARPDLNGKTSHADSPVEFDPDELPDESPRNGIHPPQATGREQAWLAEDVLVGEPLDAVMEVEEEVEPAPRKSRIFLVVIILALVAAGCLAALLVVFSDWDLLQQSFVPATKNKSDGQRKDSSPAEKKNMEIIPLPLPPAAPDDKQSMLGAPPSPARQVAFNYPPLAGTIFVDSSSRTGPPKIS